MHRIGDESLSRVDRQSAAVVDFARALALSWSGD